MKDRPLEFDEVKTGKNTYHTILSIDSCKVCMAQDDEGNWVRNKIDKYCITHNYKETTKYALKWIPYITPLMVQRHFEKHSEYISKLKEEIKNIAETTALDRMDRIEEQLDPDDVISEIITRGGRKIQSGEMDVDGKLLLGALKEQGARKKFGSLSQILMEMDNARFKKPEEGELLDATTGESTSTIQG